MPLYFVFIDLGVRLLVQFACTALLVKAIPVSEFADVSFIVVVFTYFAVVINATFDSLINKKISEGEGLFYSYSLTLKFLGYVPCVVFAILFFWGNWYLLPVVISVALGIISEHQDIRLRYAENYKPFRWRLASSLSMSPVKLYFCAGGDVFLYLLAGVVEAFVVVLINTWYVRIAFKCSGIFYFVKGEWVDILKAFAAGFSIFTFFRLDQFFVYGHLGRLDYAYYVLAVRFNELVNSGVSIISRYYLPRVFQCEGSFRTVALRLFYAQIVFSMISAFVLFIYLEVWVPEYIKAWSVYLVLCASGYFLIFGQLRGVYFVRRNILMPDTYNAVLGILVFAGFLHAVQDVTAQYVAVAYCLGFFVSGVLSTLFYRPGRDFIKRLGW